MFQNLELMKASKISKYIFQNPPKDCDYVILDERNEKIYFLELKYMKKIEKKRDSRATKKLVKNGLNTFILFRLII